MPAFQSVKLDVVRHHDPADQKAILEPLVAFNLSRVQAALRPPLAILIRQGEGTEVIGRLWGHFTYDWLFVELLFVPERLRGTGIGREIMARAESVAATEGCIGVWLDTFEFQAVGFYEKLDYTSFGVLEDHPDGQRRFFLKKRLTTAG